jgi:hypothetical protein
MEEKKKRCEISFDVPLEYRNKLKTKAAELGITMNLFIVTAIDCYFLLLEKKNNNEMKKN